MIASLIFGTDRIAPELCFCPRCPSASDHERESIGYPGARSSRFNLTRRYVGFGIKTMGFFFQTDTLLLILNCVNLNATQFSGDGNVMKQRQCYRKHVTNGITRYTIRKWSWFSRFFSSSDVDSDWKVRVVFNPSIDFKKNYVFLKVFETKYVSWIIRPTWLLKSVEIVNSWQMVPHLVLLDINMS